jgi:acyl-coenzyme A thioesterase PaaI-like protein
MPYDAVVGVYNPLAPPVAMDLTGPHARGTVVFTPQYEGPPGCVQGGVLAACFDIVLSGATYIHDAAGPTVSLTLRYRKPTKLLVESVIEAELDRQEGVRTYAKGRLLQDGIVTVEAEAVFANIGRDRTRRLGG